MLLRSITLGAVSIVLSHAIGVPRAQAQDQAGEVYVDRGACPFECCRYGNWEARDSLVAYTSEGDTSRVAFRIRSGERFRADTGNVHVDVGILLASGPGVYGVKYEPGRVIRVPIAAEDTIYVLSYAGEGTYRILYDDEVLYAGWHGPQGENTRQIRERGSEIWWVHAVNGSGEAGWLRFEEPRYGTPVDGADACG